MLCEWLISLVPYTIHVCNKWSFMYRIDLWNKIYHWNRNDLMALCNFFYWVLGQKINLIEFMIILTVPAANYVEKTEVMLVFFGKSFIVDCSTQMTRTRWRDFESLCRSLFTHLVPLKSWENVDIPRALIYYSTSSRKV